MKARYTAATLTAATATTLLLSTGAASAATFDEAEKPGYDGGWVSVSYNAAANKARAQSSQNLTPRLEYKMDLLWDDALTATDYEATTYLGGAFDNNATDGPFRACIDTGIDIGGGSGGNTVCTGWVNGK